MSEELLSKDEMDALAEGVANGKISVASGASMSGEIRPYDFMRPAHILNIKLPVLDIIHERFSKAFQSGLFSQLQRNIEVSFLGTEMQKYVDYVSSLPVHMSVNRVRVKGLNGIMLFNLDYKLIFMILDGFFGGKGAVGTAIPDRELTDIEKRVTEKILKISFKHLESAWSSVADMSFEFLQMENRYQVSAIIDSSDMVVVSRFIFKIDNEESELDICIPYTILEPIKSILANSVKKMQASPDPQWQKKLFQSMHNPMLEIKCIFSETEVSLRDLINIKEGDVIPIDMGDESIVASDDIPLFRAKIGVSKDHAAVRFLEWC